MEEKTFNVIMLFVSIMFITWFALDIYEKTRPASRKDAVSRDSIIYETRRGYVEPIGTGQLHFTEVRKGNTIYGVWITTDSTNTPTDINVQPLYTKEYGSK